MTPAAMSSTASVPGFDQTISGMDDITTQYIHYVLDYCTYLVYALPSDHILSRSHNNNHRLLLLCTEFLKNAQDTICDALL